MGGTQHGLGIGKPHTVISAAEDRAEQLKIKLLFLLDSVGITAHFKLQLYFLVFGFLLPAFIHKSFVPFGAIVNGIFS